MIEQLSQDPNEKVLAVAEPFFEKVLPRLLRPLENRGRTIKPCLVNGDLWYGNATMDAKTDLPNHF
jgi:protein-ribulosamine 3-kinase